MPELRGETKFAVGDLVYFRTASHHNGTRPRRYVVTERYLQECAGGVQVLYRLGGLPERTDHLIRETELTAEMPPYSDWLEEHDDRRWAKRIERNSESGE